MSENVLQIVATEFAEKSDSFESQMTRERYEISSKFVPFAC